MKKGIREADGQSLLPGLKSKIIPIFGALYMPLNQKDSIQFNS